LFEEQGMRGSVGRY